MIVLVLVLICVAIYGMVIIGKKKEFLNPIVCFSFPLFFQIIIYALFFLKNHTLLEQTFYLYALGIVMFCLGYMIISIQETKCVKGEGELEAIYIAPEIEKVIKIIGYIAILLSIIYSFEIMLNGPYGSNIILNIRWMSLYSDYSRSGVATYGLFIYGVLTKIWLYNSIANKEKKIRIRPYIVYVLLSLFTSMSRTGFVEGIFCFVYIFLLGIKKKGFVLDKRKLSLVGLIVVFLVVFIWITLGRGGSLNNLLSEDSFLYAYLIEPIVGFEQRILPLSSKGNGYYVLGAISSVLLVLGVDFETIGVHINNYGGKVFGFLAGPYFDGGVVGVAVCMFINGAVLAYIYNRNLRFRGRWTILYTSCIYSMVIAFFDYQFFMMSQVYTVLVLLLTMVKFSNGKLKIKRTF